MPSSTNSVVFGSVSALPGWSVRPFLRSLRATDYRGKICLFVSRMAPEDLQELRGLADDVIEVDPDFAVIDPEIPAPLLRFISWTRATPKVRRIYPLLFRLLSACGASHEARRRRRNWLEYRLEGLQALRYKLYRQYLDPRKHDYVFVTDVRDVFFQRDPFEGEVAELEFFLEPDHVTIGTDPFNREWIRNLYGTRVLRQLTSRNVSCSGTTRGNAVGMARYLGAMAAEVQRHARPLRSHDQGIHNALLHQERLGACRIYRNEEGPVITLGLVKDVRLNDVREVINRDGTVPAIVHQYDRHNWLESEVRQRFGGEPTSATST